MGQKVHPHGLRLGIIRGWDSHWYAERGTYAEQLLEDVELRKYIKKRLFNTGIAQVEIERKATKSMSPFTRQNLGWSLARAAAK